MKGPLIIFIWERKEGRKEGGGRSNQKNSPITKKLPVKANVTMPKGILDSVCSPLLDRNSNNSV